MREKGESTIVQSVTDEPRIQSETARIRREQWKEREKTHAKMTKEGCRAPKNYKQQSLTAIIDDTWGKTHNMAQSMWSTPLIMSSGVLVTPIARRCKQSRA